MTNETITNLIVNSDGGARGNPGPAGIGVVVKLMTDTRKITTKHEISKYIGEKTNNQAEYQAVIEALKWIQENSLTKGISKGKDDVFAEFLLDSELVVKQLNGEYKIKNEGLKPLFWEIRDLIIRIGVKVSFEHICREENSEADKLVNIAIDEHLKGK